MKLTPHDLIAIARGMIILILSVAVHEFGHAIVASKLGDDTPERQGRVTLNPVAHADPLGTLILPLVSMIFTAQAGHPITTGFGWGKPVEHNPMRFTRKIRMVTGQALVAVAGPLMNLLFGTVLAILHFCLVRYQVIQAEGQLSEGLFLAVSVNYALLFFNLLPVPPLDGGWILTWATPYKYRRHLEHYQTYSTFVFMAVIFIPQLQWLFLTPARWLLEHVYLALAAILGA